MLLWCRATGCHLPKLVCSRAPPKLTPPSQPSCSLLHPSSASLLASPHLLVATATTSYSFLAFNLCSLTVSLASGLAKSELCLSPEAASQTPRGKRVGTFGHCYLCSVRGAQPGSSPGHWPTCGLAAFVLGTHLNPVCRGGSARQLHSRRGLGLAALRACYIFL